MVRVNTTQNVHGLNQIFFGFNPNIFLQVRAPPDPGHEAAAERGPGGHPAALPRQARLLRHREPRPRGGEDLRRVQGTGKAGNVAKNRFLSLKDLAET